MKDSTIETIAPLLSALRGYEVLNEIRPMVFHLDGRNFIHFHEGPEGVFADVLLSTGRVHMPVSTESEQAELMDRIEEKLSTLDSHGVRKPQRKKTRHERDA